MTEKTRAVPNLINVVLMKVIVIQTLIVKVILCVGLIIAMVQTSIPQMTVALLVHFALHKTCSSDKHS